MASQRMWCLGLVAALATLASVARAEEVSLSASSDPARDAVVGQLDAFEHDDVDAAWKYAAPEIKAKFDSPAKFFDMVKANYAPIYHHRSMDIGPAAQRGDEVGFRVTLVSEENDVYEAMFVVSRQTDGSWRTSACVLSKAAQTSV